MDGRRRTRWAGLVGLTAARLWKRAIRTVTGRIVATISAVALTIALLVIITGVALALADSGVTSETDADIAVTPADSGTASTVDAVEGPQLGLASERAETMRAESGVDHASPVLLETVQLESTTGEPRTVLLVGVVPDEESRTVAGLPTTALEPAANGDSPSSEDEPAGSEIVLSRTAAERVNATETDEVVISGANTPPGEPTEPENSEAATEAETPEGPSLTVVAVEDAGSDPETDVPIALVQLSELQSIAGTGDTDLATQILVWGDPGAARTAAEETYPHASIDATNGRGPSTLLGDGLALATSLLALVVGVTICAAFVATTMGLTVEQDRRTLAVLESIGFPARSRFTIVALTTGITTLCGALFGLCLGVLGIVAINAVASATLASDTVAVITPLFVPYAIAVALLSGLVAVPYPLAVAAQTSVLEEVSR